jgi:cytochrome P450
VSATAEIPYLDLSDPEFVIDSEEVVEARERSWWARTNYGIAVLRYEQVGLMLKDRRLRQGSHAWPPLNGVRTGPLVDWWNGSLLNLEGDDHRRVRRLLNPAFTPGLVNGLSPYFRELAGELIDRFAPRGEVEFVSEFAEPYAARVIATMLGIPESEWQRLAQLSSDLGLFLGVTIAEDLDRIEAGLEGLYGYADELIAERKDSPGDDFTSGLIRARFEEDKLSDDELRVSLVLMIFGGMDTTRNQLGLAMQTFMDHPDQWALLAERPELGPAAVEEVMRVNPTTTWVTREALEDIEFEGLEISAGTTIHLLTGAAGSDPRAYSPPEFDITVEERTRHYGFGGGLHHCIGHFVARGDMSEALPLLAARMRDPRPDGEVRSLPRSGNTGPVELPVAFDAPGD